LCAVARWRIERAGDGSELDRERTRLTKAQADKAELEAALLRSDTVRTPLIEQHWQAMVAAMRAELLALPSRAAPRVLGMTDHNDLVDTLRDEVHSALAHIAGDAFPEEVRRRIDELNKENNE
jgi:phage terminase Nu1 subunit (DNA packaging protein)